MLWGGVKSTIEIMHMLPTCLAQTGEKNVR
jgi:hypothetical protein